jgi:hypothetical protein
MYKEFRVDDDAATSSSMIDSGQGKKRKADDDDDDDFDIIAHRFGKDEVVKDELERYLKSPPLSVSTKEANLSFDLIAWWRANEMIYPTLARMAYELYSIPAMSAEVERVFSRFYYKVWTDTCSAKLTLRDRRNRLLTESVESVECLHNWLLSGLIEGVLDGMDADDLMDLDEWARKADFQGLMTWQGESADFMCDFDDFVDLSIVVSSTAINNINKRWITFDFDELQGEIVDWRKSAS